MKDQTCIAGPYFFNRFKESWKKALINGLSHPVLFVIAWLTLFSSPAAGQEMSNSRLRLQLGISDEGIPIIKEATWNDSGLTIFTDAGTPDGLKSWVSSRFIPTSSNQETAPHWVVTEGTNFMRAEASRTLLKGLIITWVVDLPKNGGLFRLSVRMKNTGEGQRSIDWFPAWASSWSVNGGVDWVRYWRSLDFARTDKVLRAGKKLELSSRLHSSQEGDENPYWIVGGSGQRLHFGLEWCGGWKTKIKRDDNAITFSASLPPEETQLVLKSGESILGPVLIVTPTSETDEIFNRRAWMSERLALGRILYGGPDRYFPLTYNHWYSVRRSISGDYLNRQLEAMTPYGFDAFIVDAGWYDKVGGWNPSQTKFEQGEFESLMASVRAKGMRAGVWSSPQFVNVPDDRELPPEVEDPGFYTAFLDAYLLDLAQSNFKGRLLNHMTMLRERYSINWWKFDSTLFIENTSLGVMRNVVAYQNSFRAMRRMHPDLFIESCQGGGRMINEFTQLASQIQWLRDGGENDVFHARQNIETVLGALDFVFPWMAYSWSNTIEEMDQNDDELTRYYCRSSMAGTWGFSSDLPKIGSRQQNIILQEIERYRQLNELKQNCLYDLQPPVKGATSASVTFYDAQKEKAGTLLYRWDAKDAFDQKVVFKNLQPESFYTVRDVDLNIETRLTGEQLMEDGLIVAFDSKRRSALLFVEIVR